MSPKTLAAETPLKGLLQVACVLQINGRFEGEIHSTGRLMVGEGAVRHPSIKVGSAVIGDRVCGDLKAIDSVEMLPTARVCGDMGAARLIVADRVAFEGELEMGDSPKGNNGSGPSSSRSIGAKVSGA